MKHEPTDYDIHRAAQLGSAPDTDYTQQLQRLWAIKNTTTEDNTPTNQEDN